MEDAIGGVGKDDDLFQYAQLLQEMEELIQLGAFVQSVNSIDDLLAVHASDHPRVIVASRLP
jgi:hypothetical protein